MDCLCVLRRLPFTWWPSINVLSNARKYRNRNDSIENILTKLTQFTIQIVFTNSISMFGSYGQKFYVIPFGRNVEISFIHTHFFHSARPDADLMGQPNVCIFVCVRETTTTKMARITASATNYHTPTKNHAYKLTIYVHIDVKHRGDFELENDCHRQAKTTQ